MKEPVSFFFLSVLFFSWSLLFRPFLLVSIYVTCEKKRGLFFTEDVPEQLLKET